MSGDEPTRIALATPTSPAVATRWVAPEYRKRVTATDRLSQSLPRALRTSLEAIGGLYTMFAASLYGLFADLVQRKFQFTEFVERSWFLVSVALLPAILVSVPLGVAIALQVGALAAQIGATSFVGAADAIGVLREASPIVTALLLAGVGGSAVCAELGARTIREEIDAMSVLGVSPVHRLIVPRVWACVLVAVFLNGMVSVVGVAGGYVFNVLVQGGTPGAYLSSFSSLAQISDLYVGEIKAVVFGFLAAVVASYRGLHPRPGPKGVGDAVNESVVITFVLLFLVNLGITTLYLRIVPSKIT
jgi:phospholipid/cholesterol/gamma-HCH transport system permease protein